MKTYTKIMNWLNDDQPALLYQMEEGYALVSWQNIQAGKQEEAAGRVRLMGLVTLGAIIMPLFWLV
ncbi:MAG: hypothetical protein COY40_01425 [Alphaproteobacteria bacterium CG_4_10_14_0_8_um_filter_53_9]|nr:MAG: hypothetical protein COY40_01425 [Alphaproteobacteria bacterium CG_4_10_14_0_8_um_filter_53_9]